MGPPLSWGTYKSKHQLFFFVQFAHNNHGLEFLNSERSKCTRFMNLTLKRYRCLTPIILWETLKSGRVYHHLPFRVQWFNTKVISNLQNIRECKRSSKFLTAALGHSTLLGFDSDCYFFLYLSQWDCSFQISISSTGAIKPFNFIPWDSSDHTCKKTIMKSSVTYAMHIKVQ